MLMYLWVAIGGALGTVARFWINGVVSRHFGETFPWGTMLINISGSFMIGFFGGYTTFSSFSLQTLNLANEGEWLRAGANILLSVVLCLAGVWLGWLLANNFKQIK